MIHTVTFNPSLDYIVRLDELVLGTINRVSYEQILPGGKGVNVSIVLGNLGHANRALGFAAGFTGVELEALLKEYGV
ncbi:MAG TPA: 1-phosphofructokinase, partial [Atopobiaceae bacterium]|nr:1-phosphofructokinase [Atopobiaceae bacterium]